MLDTHPSCPDNHRQQPVAQDTRRLFLAIHLSTEIVATLGEIRQHAIPIDQDIRWVRPEHLHCTVRFLGECTADQATTIKAIAADIAAATIPFHLHVGHLGVFPNPRQPRVLWADILAGKQSLLTIHQGIDTALLGAGIIAQKETFQPHITLGRVRDRLPVQRLAAIGQFITKAPPLDFGDQQVTTLTLIHSALSKSGPMYQDIMNWPLTGSGTG